MHIDLDIFKKLSNNIEPEKGRILIAEPFLKGYYFSRSIILLTEYNEQGSMGLVLNKPLDLTLDKLVKDVPVNEFPIWCGGPVGNEKLFYLHNSPGIPGSISVNKGLFFGGDFAVIRSMIQNQSLTESDIRFFLGYSGWLPGQLKQEIDEDSWLVSQTSIKKTLFNDTEFLWRDVVESMGDRYSMWTNFPADPELN